MVIIRLLTNRLKDSNRERFLAHLEASYTLENTVLFSLVDGYEPKIQALIPPAIIATGEVYITQCAERGTKANAQIGTVGSVDWETESMPGWNMGSDAQ